MAVSQMGNYQDYLKRQPSPLREIETVPVRQHMFGNPFKIDKVGRQWGWGGVVFVGGGVCGGGGGQVTGGRWSGACPTCGGGQWNYVASAVCGNGG